MQQEKNKSHKGVPHKATSFFFFFIAEILQAKRERQDIFKVLKGKTLQPRINYPARLSFLI